VLRKGGGCGGWLGGSLELRCGHSSRVLPVVQAKVPTAGYRIARCHIWAQLIRNRWKQKLSLLWREREREVGAGGEARQAHGGAANRGAGVTLMPVNTQKAIASIRHTVNFPLPHRFPLPQFSPLAPPSVRHVAPRHHCALDSLGRLWGPGQGLLRYNLPRRRLASCMSCVVTAIAARG